MDLTGRCTEHAFQPARGVCPQCGHEYCVECLAFPRGKDRKPVCVGCAAKKLGYHRNSRSKNKLNPLARRKRYRAHKEAQHERLTGDSSAS